MNQILARRDVWLGVIPAKAATQVWLQGQKLMAPRSARAVFLGLRGVRTCESFDVVLLSCRKGAFNRDVRIDLADFEKLGIRVIASLTIDRLR